MYVVPVPHPPDPACACQDGLEHWRRFVPVPHPMVLRSEACSTVGCLGPVEHGVHVRKIGLQGLGDTQLYIIPLCDACQRAAQDRPFQVKATTGFAPADPRQTCRRADPGIVIGVSRSGGVSCR